MISRIAEQSFWMFRYLEREELFARRYLYTHLYSLDSFDHSFDEFFQILQPSEQFLFSKLYNGQDKDEELIPYFRVWQELNPDSLLTLFGAARGNALLIRETISENMWQMINKLYLWFQQESTKNLYMTERYNFYTHIIETIQLIKGIFFNSQLRDGYYGVMLIARLLEIALQIEGLYRHALDPRRRRGDRRPAAGGTGAAVQGSKIRFPGHAVFDEACRTGGPG